MPSAAHVRDGYLAFQANDNRDAMYATASFLVGHFWHKPAQLANALGVLLLTWNQAFYRYGRFDFTRLEACLRGNKARLARLRDRHIFDAARGDAIVTRALFLAFLDALAITSGPKRGTKSPVAAAKALHLLAPSYFPLWDDKIARAYGCHYAKHPDDAYLRFSSKMQALGQSLPTRLHSGRRGKTLLKLIDEYNYARFTKGWTSREGDG